MVRAIVSSRSTATRLITKNIPGRYYGRNPNRHYGDVFKQQPHTATLLEQQMKARGLSTEGQAADGTECLDCIQTHADQARAWLQRVVRMEKEFAGGIEHGAVSPPPHLEVVLQSGSRPPASHARSVLRAQRGRVVSSSPRPRRGNQDVHVHGPAARPRVRCPPGAWRHDP
jgi:hypothetical protein